MTKKIGNVKKKIIVEKKKVGVTGQNVKSVIISRSSLKQFYCLQTIRWCTIQVSKIMFRVRTQFNRLLFPTNATCSDVPLNSSKLPNFTAVCWSSTLQHDTTQQSTHIIKTSICNQSSTKHTHTHMRKLLLCVISTELDLRFQILLFSNRSK